MRLLKGAQREGGDADQHCPRQRQDGGLLHVHCRSFTTLNLDHNRQGIEAFQSLQVYDMQLDRLASGISTDQGEHAEQRCTGTRKM